MRYRELVRRSGRSTLSHTRLRSPLQRSRASAVPVNSAGSGTALFHVVAELQPANLIKLEPAQGPA